MSENESELKKRRSGRIKLIAFAAMVFALAAAFIISGLVQRSRIRALGGPIKVQISNASDEKLRADVIVREQLATLEMDPGESGLLRFSTPRDTHLLVRVYRKNVLVTELEEGYFTPGVPSEVNVRLNSAESVDVEFPSEN